MPQARILIAQGGGPTAVINQSLIGAVLAARQSPSVELVYGARHGVRGIIQQDLLNLSLETEVHLNAVAQTPSSALGSTRDKPDAAYCQKIMQVLKAHQITHFFYIGGNDSSDTVRIVAEQARAVGYGLTAVHIPKTIDNDLMGNDHTPGFPSAAKFVAQAFAGADLDNRSLPGVYVAVVMGRHAGFLTAASAAARVQEDDGPHLIYLPERSFSIDAFLADVKRVTDQLGRCVVAVSEGVHDASGEPIMAKLMAQRQGTAETDAHGNVQLSGSGALADLLCDEIKAKLGLKRVRGDTFGYLQRSFLGCVSDIDAREAREVGAFAVQWALTQSRHGAVTGSVAIERVGDYRTELKIQPLEAVAAKTKVMPDAFIHPDGNYVTPAFVDYLRPLLGSALPPVSLLRAHPVERMPLD
jgi:6-phosphofructokinase 1